MHVVKYIIDSHDLRRREKLQFCVQVFIADIELQELTHAEDRACVLYCDMTEAELLKRLLERKFNVSKSNFHIFTPLEAKNFQQVLKLQNSTLSYHKRGYRLRLGNAII